VAALWRIDGHTTPAIIGCLMLPAAIGYPLVLHGWREITQARSGLSTVVFAALVTVPLLWKLAAGQLADFLLMYAIVTSAAWYVAGTLSDRRSPAFAAGFAAGWCGLVKNEGILWVACVFFVCSCTLLVRTSVARRRWTSLTAGVALPVLVLVLFKALLAPASDLIDPSRTFAVGEIIQPGTLWNQSPLLLRTELLFLPVRYEVVGQWIASAALNWRDWGCVFVLLPITAVWRPRGRIVCRPLLIAVGMQCAGYVLVYLTTPYHQYWHLSTSLGRVLMHVLPVLLALLAFQLPNGEESAASECVAQDTAPPAWRWAGALVLAGASIWNCAACLNGQWRLGDLPRIDPERYEPLQLPDVEVASYVSDDLGDRALYSAQFSAAPIVLVVDRREQVLIAEFADEAKLREYCDRHEWTLERNIGGTGWARDAGGRGRVRGLVQVRRVPRML
jgi:hypothetical protein